MEHLTIVQLLLDITQKVRELWGRLDKKIVLSSSVAAIVTTGILVGGYFWTHPPSAPSAPKILGGLDLGRYCFSHGFEGNDDKRCSSKIDLTKACSWQHSASDHAKSPGPYSTGCYNSRDKYLGGISNMQGYCEDSFEMTASVQAWVAGKDWVCRSDINVEVACNWQYDKLALTARKVGGVWKCYDSEQLS